MVVLEVAQACMLGWRPPEQTDRSSCRYPESQGIYLEVYPKRRGLTSCRCFSICRCCRKRSSSEDHNCVNTTSLVPEERKMVWRKYNEDLEYIGSYAMDNLCMALHCVWTTDDYRSAVLKSANLRGDADTVSAVAGQIAGAIYGASSMPAAWCEQLFRWDGGDVALKAWLLYHREDARLLEKAVGRKASAAESAKELASGISDAGPKTLEHKSAGVGGKADNVVLVGVAGPTRGGKSCLASALREQYPGATIVNQDRYFKRDGETPDCIDFRRMKADLRRLLASAEKQASSKNPVVVVAEGFLLFADEDLESWFDVRIFLRLDKDVCYARRLATKKAGLAGEKFDRFFEKSIWPAHEAHGAPHLDGAHVLDGSSPQEEILAAATDLVQKALDAVPTASRRTRASGSRA